MIEVGSYDLLNGEKKLVEPISNLIKKLKVDLIYKRQLGKFNFNSIEDQLLKISYTSASPEFNENLIKQAIKFAQESQMKILAKIVNSISEKIKAKDAEIEFLINSIKNQEESRKFAAIIAIRGINNKIPALESKIKYLLKLIPEEENNLLLLKSNSSFLLQRASSSPTLQQIIYSYNKQIINMKNELQILNQEKDNLELELKLVNDQSNTTQSIRELVTSEIKPSQFLTILIGTIFGFIFSIF